ncbi:hypothetical protein [Natrialba taiwanensis]|uniref:Uncharacterized protein n=1 Tax=Natrialba taiwanensis DSM 12281 TaxID=1230458 RepID=M0A0W0_9EURY|nr:hypothetical protein [Natrialba taiwanensis]ELY91472.1 hypothetical protein C484_10606 [Natrialba taiwanensis DSM 12281]
MDLEQYTRGPAKWLLDASGESVTIVTRTQTGQDEYGDPEYSTTETEATAEIVLRGTPAFERRIDGVDSDVRAVAWVMDTHTVESDDGLTTIKSSTHEFELHNWFDEHNGKLRLHLTDA